ncbi:MAG TPA: glutamate synthase central domain-containing protein, partial [Kofleriaceae bacterium]|nr:glutamate synthase central domain-containing protein [Kofleriaceae bacterium]
MRPGGLYDPDTERDSCGVGFVAHIRGHKSREIVDQALEVLRRLSHRAATGADPETGDGAGILLQIPHRFFKREGLRLGFDMPHRRGYGVGMVFLPAEPAARRACEQVLEEVVAEEGQRLIGWRDVPIDDGQIGRVAHAVLPVIRQVYIARRRLVPTAFERKLYVIRKLTENRVRERAADIDPDARFHVASLSAETIVYKGLLLPGRLGAFYRDLQDPDFVAALAVVHSRFSTNTFPTWDLAQPLRFIAHNGEINTVQGNRNWTNARKSLLSSGKFGGRIDRLFPIIVPGKSDSAQFDNMLELLHLGGRSLPHAMMMMIPEAWEANPDLDRERADFYRYAATLMEPWDGPAAIVFSDGHLVGATLDRNGLRPARYLITADDRVILASEAGVLDVAPHLVRARGRLCPGRMFLVDTVQGRILADEEVKREVVSRFPYGRWLRDNVFELPEVPSAEDPPTLSGDELARLQRCFGYTLEDLRLLVAPMAEDGKEPVGSMGTDTPLAALSDQAPSLFAYFHQLFAQVTNPPIDPIRERMVMTLDTNIGPDGNTFEETPEQCHSLHIGAPVLTNHHLHAIAAVTEGVFDPTRLSVLYRASDDPDSLAAAIDRLCAAAVEAVDEGRNILILSDRGVDAEHAPIPALLALSAVQQHLTRLGIRMQAGLVVETGEAREVHDVALLVGYGAAAVNPYLALDTVRAMAAAGELGAVEPDEAERRYAAAIADGLLKVMSKMGISTVQSYRGAQIFEAVGLDRDLIDRHFTGTPSRLSGVGLAELQREVRERHARAFAGPKEHRPAQSSAGADLPAGGHYQWRPDGERHKWNPATIAALQAAVGREHPDLFAEYSRLVDDEDGALCTLRGL